jgi:hypothetical protein
MTDVEAAVPLASKDPDSACPRSTRHFKQGVQEVACACGGYAFFALMFATFLGVSLVLPIVELSFAHSSYGRGTALGKWLEVDGSAMIVTLVAFLCSGFVSVVTLLRGVFFLNAFFTAWTAVGFLVYYLALLAASCDAQLSAHMCARLFMGLVHIAAVVNKYVC